MYSAAIDLLPATRDASFVEVRVGLRPATPDGLPILGRSAESPAIVYATGHYRNGVLLTPLTATLIADVVTGTTSDPMLVPVSPSRFVESRTPRG